MSIQETVLAQIRTNHTYKLDVATGRQNLSGSDLRGRAQQSGRSYFRSRVYVVNLWIDAEGHIRRNAKTQELTLEEGTIPDDAEAGLCAVGDCWKY